MINSSVLATYNYLYILLCLDSYLLMIQTLVSRTCSSFGDRTFAASGPQVWNSLPPNLRLRVL